jgi:uncharacterized phage protein (TIGR01671 family)
MLKRALEFRAWSPKNKRMYYEDKEAHGNMASFLFYNVGEDDHLLQFTGLLDKNGKKVFEGDIVKASAYSPQHYLIQFIEGGFAAFAKDTFPIDINHFYPSNGCMFEVVGNFYTHAYLLEIEK